MSEFSHDKSGLAPCPWCGNDGETTIRENGRMWTGRSMSEPASVSIMHWCPAKPGQPRRAIERVGRDLESARAAWNERAPLATPAEPTVTTRKIADALSERDRAELATFSEYLRDRYRYKNDDMAGDAFAAKWDAYERGQSNRPTPQP